MPEACSHNKQGCSFESSITYRRIGRAAFSFKPTQTITLIFIREALIPSAALKRIHQKLKLLAWPCPRNFFRSGKPVRGFICL
jgi:hypothetical protein